MRKIILLLAIVLLPLTVSCRKEETYGILEVNVYAEPARDFKLEVYPYQERNWNLPVFSKKIRGAVVSEEIRLCPGNYIIEVIPGGHTEGVNIIAGEKTEVQVRLD